MGRLFARLFRSWPALVLVFIFPAGAHAHTAIPGMGEVASGFVHPLMTPAHVVVMIGLALLLGQRKPFRLSMPMTIFASVAVIGLLVTTSGRFKAEPPAFLACVSLLLGFCVAVAANLPQWAIAILGAMAAATLSLDSAADGALTSWGIAKTLFGTWISLLLIVFDLAYYVSLVPPRKWTQIAVRVAGSWIGAISFLVLAFALKH